jgi:hypothetical protein
MNWEEVNRRYKGTGNPAIDLIGHEDFSITSFESSLLPIMQINDEYLFGDIWPRIDETIQMQDQIKAEYPDGPEKDNLLQALTRQLIKLQDALPEQADVNEIIRRSDPFSAYIEDRAVRNWIRNEFPDITGADRVWDEERGRYRWDLTYLIYEGSEIGEVIIKVNTKAKDDLGVVRVVEREVPWKITPKFLEGYLNHHRPTRSVPTGTTNAQGRPKYKTIYDENGEKANHALSDKFRAWAGQNPDQFETTVPRYNRAYRSFRERFYSDKELDVPGMSSVFKGKPLTIQPHQWQTIGRMDHLASGIIAHGVGGGKTLSGILLSQQRKDK